MKTIIIPATKDASLSSLLPDTNIGGKNEIENKGYGTKKFIKGSDITYPAMYLYSGEENIKDAFIIGGFDLSKIDGEIKNASLKFYINYLYIFTIFLFYFLTIAIISA